MLAFSVALNCQLQEGKFFQDDTCAEADYLAEKAILISLQADSHTMPYTTLLVN
jgi:hypothetical protein